MPSYNAWKRNGTEIRCTNDNFSLTDLLKTELKWDGFCLSDWDAIPQITAGAEIITPKKMEFLYQCRNRYGHDRQSMGR
jgi:beta-glucosidase-like glycosyl hydrolase